LNDDVATLVVELDNLYTIVDGDAEATQEAIDALKEDIEKNTLDIDSNLYMIAVLGDEIIVIKENMELKQNIINGVCPDGQAVVSANDEENDGVLICKSVSGSGDLEKTVITKIMDVRRYQTKTIEAVCPVDTVATGGGFIANARDMEVFSNEPVGNAWRVIVKNNAWNSVSVTSKVVCLKLQ